MKIYFHPDAAAAYYVLLQWPTFIVYQDIGRKEFNRTNQSN